jgi:catechol 2,3-dioxygenase-like lactoylglutathione lyase family enzyme
MVAIRRPLAPGSGRVARSWQQAGGLERLDMYLMISKYIDVRQFIYYIDIYRYIPEIKMRIQLALNVSDLAEAVEYYSRLFGTRPHKRRPGYANFSIEAPPLKLVLFEQPGAKERLNHLGVEVTVDSELDDAEARLQLSDLIASNRSTSICCHAEQDKFWSVGPDGERWEWYRITDDRPAERKTNCCT